MRSFSHTPYASFSEVSPTLLMLVLVRSFSLLMLVLVRNFSYTRRAGFSGGVSITLIVLVLVKSFTYTHDSFSGEFFLHS